MTRAAAEAQMMQNRPSAVRTRALRLEPALDPALEPAAEAGRGRYYPGRLGGGLGDPDSGPGGPAPGASAKYAKLEG